MCVHTHTHTPEDCFSLQNLQCKRGALRLLSSSIPLSPAPSWLLSAGEALLRDMPLTPSQLFAFTSLLKKSEISLWVPQTPGNLH